MAHCYEINDDILENYNREEVPLWLTSTRKNKSRGQRHFNYFRRLPAAIFATAGSDTNIKKNPYQKTCNKHYGTRTQYI
jgi:hypothetical protein